MVGLQLRYNEYNLTMDEIVEIKQLCNSFGVRPVCSIDYDEINSNNEMITFDFGADIKRKDAFKRGLLRLLDNNINLGHTPRRPDYNHRAACPWVQS